MNFIFVTFDIVLYQVYNLVQKTIIYTHKTKNNVHVDVYYISYVYRHCGSNKWNIFIALHLYFIEMSSTHHK